MQDLVERFHVPYRGVALIRLQGTELVRPRQAENVLGQVIEHHLLGHWRYSHEPRFTPVPLDVIFGRIAKPTVRLQRGIRGREGGVGGEEFGYVRLLAANNTVAIQEENWIHQHQVTFDGYLMLGLPEEFTSNTVDAEGIGQLSPTLLVAKRLHAPPAGSPVTQYPEFIGTLAKNFGLQSVRGMSGGPTFGINSEPPMRYWIIALQSSWSKDSRTVFGCSFPVLASLMTEWTQSVE